MAITGINRVVIGVTDLDAAIEHYSRLLDTSFERVPASFAASFGSEVAFSWKTGVELVAPALGKGADVVGLLPKHTGLMGIVFNVDDIDDAAKTAEAAGVPVLRELRLTAEQIDFVFGGKMDRFEEVALDFERSGVPMLMARIDMKENMPDPLQDAKTCELPWIG